MTVTRVLLAGFVLFIAGNVHAAPIAVLNDTGFEATVSTQPLQLTWTLAENGAWGVGDPQAAVGAENGITPLGGATMLNFAPTGGVASDIYQVVDVSAFAGSIDAGLAAMDLGVFYNSTSTTLMGLTLLGWNSAPTSFTGASTLGGSINNFAVDGNVATWESFSLNGVALTSGVRYVGFGMHGPVSGIAYADNASMAINVRTVSVPEPGTLALFAFGLAGLGVLRRRRRLAA